MQFSNAFFPCNTWCKIARNKKRNKKWNWSVDMFFTCFKYITRPLGIWNWWNHLSYQLDEKSNYQTVLKQIVLLEWHTRWSTIPDTLIASTLVSTKNKKQRDSPQEKKKKGFERFLSEKLRFHQKVYSSLEARTYGLAFLLSLRFFFHIFTNSAAVSCHWGLLQRSYPKDCARIQHSLYLVQLELVTIN